MDRAAALSENLINESFAIAGRENVLKAAPRQPPAKAEAATFVGRFIDSCISFIASFRTPSEQELQQAKNQGAHDEVQQSLGDLYGATLDNEKIFSLSLSPYVKNQYQNYFASDIKEGKAVDPEKVKAFAESLNTSDPTISNQIRQLSEMQTQSQIQVAPAATKSKFNPIKSASRFAGSVVSFFNWKEPTVSALKSPSRKAPSTSPAADELLKVKAAAAQQAHATGGSSKPSSVTSKTGTLSTESSDTKSNSPGTAKSETTSSTSSSSSLEQPPLQSLEAALPTLSPGHTLTAKQLGELQQGKAVSTSILNPEQKQGTRFLPTVTVYQLVNVDPKKCTPEQAAKLFVDPRNTPTLMGSACPTPPEEKDGITKYQLIAAGKKGSLQAEVKTAPLTGDQTGYQVTSSLKESDLLDKNEGQCTIAPVIVGNKPQLLIIHRTASTLKIDPASTFLTGVVNSKKEEGAKSLITQFKGLIEKQAAAT